ncbi:MAG: DNA double-strand break repair helicase HerA [Saccharolobus sp.]
MIIGYVIGSATTQETLMLAEKPVRLGNYVVLEYDNMKVLGLVTKVMRGSSVLDENMNDIEIVQKLKKLNGSIPFFIKAYIKLLCDLNNNCLMPKLPPAAGTPVRGADEEELKSVYSSGNISIGTLVGTNIKVNLNINALARHLAILAATGSGKSNTVAVLSQRISELGGSVLIFDYHGEYYESDIRNLNNIEPKLNPLYLTSREFATLLEVRENASIQYRILRRAFERYKEEIREKIKEGQISLSQLNQEFKETMENYIDDEGKHENRENASGELKNKLEEFIDKYASVISLSAPDVIERIERGKVNVVNLAQLDEDSMDAVVSHYLRRILDSRKEYLRKKTGGLRFPLITVIEEAHIFLSKNDNTLTKYWASRIAREGRKFGIGLVVVSQRPKGLDENILSQMTNKIILKIVEPTDKKYILESSDNLTEDLVEQLSSLDIGEAIIIGKIVKMPAIVKIDKFEGKLLGTDPDMVSEWKKVSEEEEITSGFTNFGSGEE